MNGRIHATNQSLNGILGLVRCLVRWSSRRNADSKLIIRRKKVRPNFTSMLGLANKRFQLISHAVLF